MTSLQKEKVYVYVYVYEWVSVSIHGLKNRHIDTHVIHLFEDEKDQK